MILAQMKGLSSFDDEEWPFLKIPLEMKRCLIGYFERMHALGRIGVEPEIATISLMAANYGIFMHFSVVSQLHKGINRDEVLSRFIEVLAKGMGTTAEAGAH